MNFYIGQRIWFWTGGTDLYDNLPNLTSFEIAKIGDDELWGTKKDEWTIISDGPIYESKFAALVSKKLGLV